MNVLMNNVNDDKCNLLYFFTFFHLLFHHFFYKAVIQQKTTKTDPNDQLKNKSLTH